jgi:hypothetical protein
MAAKIREAIPPLKWLVLDNFLGPLVDQPPIDLGSFRTERSLGQPSKFCIVVPAIMLPSTILGPTQLQLENRRRIWRGLFLPARLTAGYCNWQGEGQVQIDLQLYRRLLVTSGAFDSIAVSTAPPTHRCA